LFAALLIIFKAASSWGEAVRRIALPVAIVIAAGQMAKGLAKFTSWVGFFPVAWNTPDGVSTSLAMAARTLKQPAPLTSIQVVSVTGLALVLAATWFASRELRFANGPVRPIWRLPIFVVSLVFGYVILGWGFLR
jgi:hypothetical protein